MRHRTRFVAATLVAAGLACVTINVYFPEAEIKDLSRLIEEEVQRRAAEQPPAEPAPPSGETGTAPRGAAGPVSLLDALLGVTPAYAEGVGDPEVSSPAIRAIIASRAARLNAVNEFKSGGYLGENNRGLLEARDLGGLSDLKARAELNKLVRDENQDREKLYKEIAAAKGVDASQIARIAETYAATLRAQARSGDWIQMPDGSWTQK